MFSDSTSANDQVLLQGTSPADKPYNKYTTAVYRVLAAVSNQTAVPP